MRLIASSRNWIEGAAVQQLEKTASLPGMRLAVGLPDLHPGKGSPIGAAFAVEGYLYPALVGNDIGCGIGLWRTELSAKKLRCPRARPWRPPLSRPHFSVPPHGAFDVWQEHGQQSKERHEGTRAINKTDAGVIRKFAQERRCNARGAESEAEEQP